MNRNLPKSFDDLMQNRYGRGCHGGALKVERVEDLFANHFGKKKFRRRRGANKPFAAVLSLSRDDGETLVQGPAGAREVEVMGRPPGVDAGSVEYVVMGNAYSSQASLDIAAEVLPESEPSVFQEYRVDVLQPLAESNTPLLKSESNVPAPGPTSSPRSPLPVATREKPEPPAAPLEETSRAKSTEEDIVADLQSILSGQKVFDPLTKKTVDKDKLGKSMAVASQTEAGQPPPLAPSEHAIFDRIAQSMQYANQFDIGTVELENRFSDFDKFTEVRAKAGSEKPAQPAPRPVAATPAAPAVGSADFLQDLDAIQKQRAPAGDSSTPPAPAPSIPSAPSGAGGDTGALAAPAVPPVTAPTSPAAPTQS